MVPGSPSFEGLDSGHEVCDGERESRDYANEKRPPVTSRGSRLRVSIPIPSFFTLFFCRESASLFFRGGGLKKRRGVKTNRSLSIWSGPRGDQTGGNKAYSITPLESTRLWQITRGSLCYLWIFCPPTFTSHFLLDFRYFFFFLKFISSLENFEIPIILPWIFSRYTWSFRGKFWILIIHGWL